MLQKYIAGFLFNYIDILVSECKHMVALTGHEIYDIEICTCDHFNHVFQISINIRYFNIITNHTYRRKIFING